MSAYTDWLASQGVTNPSQLKYRDASVGPQEDMSASDMADAFGGTTYGGQQHKTTAGLSGFSTPTGQYIAAGDVFRDGDTVQSIDQNADGTPRFTSHVDSPDISWGDAAMMVIGTIAAAYGIDAMSLMGAAGVGAEGAGGAATLSGMDLAADGGINALTGFGGAGAAGAGAGAANGLWDVLPEAVGNGTISSVEEVLPGLTTETAAGGIETLPATAGAAAGTSGVADPFQYGFTDTGTAGGALDTGYAGSGAVTGATGGVGTVADVTDANYVNGSDINSDAATETGTAPGGSVNEGVTTTTDGANVVDGGGGSGGTTGTTGLSDLSTADLLRLAGGAAGLAGLFGGNNSGTHYGSYQGSIPNLGAQRTQYANDNTRQPGSAPQRYFSDMTYVPNGQSTLTQAGSLTQANNVVPYGTGSNSTIGAGAGLSNTGGISSVTTNTRRNGRGRARRGFAAGGIADLSGGYDPSVGVGAATDTSGNEYINGVLHAIQNDQATNGSTFTGGGTGGYLGDGSTTQASYGINLGGGAGGGSTAQPMAAYGGQWNGDPNTLPGVVNGVQMNQQNVPTGLRGTREWGDMGTLADIYAMKNNPMSAVGTPYERFMTGGDGNGPVDFNRSAASVYMKSNGNLGPGKWQAIHDNRMAMPIAAGPHAGMLRDEVQQNQLALRDARQADHQAIRDARHQTHMAAGGMPGFDRRPRNMPSGIMSMQGPAQFSGNAFQPFDGHLSANPMGGGGGNPGFGQMGLNPMGGDGSGVAALMHGGYGPGAPAGGPSLPLGFSGGDKFRQSGPFTGAPQYASGGIAGLEPRHLKGPGDGLSDSIPATIDGNQPAKLASDEFVVPADVVSALGGGSSEGGARKLYAMMDRIRQQAHGTKKQVRPVKESTVMPG
jgi:hypothetical protein